MTDHATKTNAAPTEWRTIGQVYSDHGHLTICDSSCADDAYDLWMDSDIDLNECAKKGIRSFQLLREDECPVGVTFKPGFGDDAVFDVEARYEDGVIVEIRVRFFGDELMTETEERDRIEEGGT